MFPTGRGSWIPAEAEGGTWTTNHRQSTPNEDYGNGTQKQIQLRESIYPILFLTPVFQNLANDYLVFLTISNTELAQIVFNLIIGIFVISQNQG